MKHNLTINADGVLGIGIIYHKAPVISLRNTKSTKWSRFRVFTGGTDKCLVRNTVNTLFVNAINNSKIFSTVYLYHKRGTIEKLEKTDLMPGKTVFIRARYAEIKEAMMYED